MCLRPASRGAGDVSVREPAQQQTLSLGRRASPAEDMATGISMWSIPTNRQLQRLPKDASQGRR